MDTTFRFANRKDNLLLITVKTQTFSKAFGELTHVISQAG